MSLQCASEKDPDYNETEESPAADTLLNESTRWRRAHPENWKQNVIKDKSIHGLEHTNYKKKLVKAKSVRPCLCKCIYKCNNKVDMEKQE